MQKKTKLHVLDDAGNRVWRGRCATEPAAIAAAVRRYAASAVRIGLETGPLTTWLWTALTAEGLPKVCLDGRHAKKALDMKVNKTDANMTSDLRSWYVLVGIVKSGSKARRLSIALLFFLLHCGDVFASQDPKVRRCFELAS